MDIMGGGGGGGVEKRDLHINIIMIEFFSIFLKLIGKIFWMHFIKADGFDLRS